MSNITLKMIPAWTICRWTTRALTSMPSSTTSTTSSWHRLMTGQPVRRRARPAIESGGLRYEKMLTLCRFNARKLHSYFRWPRKDTILPTKKQLPLAQEAWRTHVPTLPSSSCQRTELATVIPQNCWEISVKNWTKKSYLKLTAKLLHALMFKHLTYQVVWMIQTPSLISYRSQMRKWCKLSPC